MLDRIAVRLDATPCLPIDRSADVLLHADCTPAIVPWLTDAYPALATTPDRLWLYRTGFALRGLIHWPAYAPESELPHFHPLRQLRYLARDHGHSCTNPARN